MMIYFIIILAIATRFIPHMPNFAPVTALAIFSAVYLPKKQAVAIPLAVRFVSDLFLGFFQWPLMVAVYASHLAGVLLGLWIKQSVNVIPEPRLVGISGIQSKPDSGSRLSSDSAGMTRNKWIKITGSSLAASIIFFAVTNFAYFYPYYSHNISGIVAAYTNGLPFLRGTVLGDLSYTFALFGSYELALRFIKNRSKRAVPQNLA